LHTLGYEGRDPGGFLAELVAARVTTLVDVRELPSSRRRGFSKTALAESLRAAGIEYVHERQLGNPKPLRDAWKAGDAERGAAGYRAHLAAASGGRLDALAERVAQGGVCLMCVERDASDCHRSILVEAVAERIPGLDVRHL